MFTRRDFMLSTAAAAAVAAPVMTRAQVTAPAANAPANNQQQTILRLLRRSIEVNGKPASIMGIRQPNGSYGLNTAVNTPFRVRVENQLDVPSLIHWHGLTPPWQQDGVPGVSGPPIAAGGTADYDFPLPFGGTFWMHSHQGLQEQTLLSAPLIIHDGRDRNDQQDIVLMLYDFSFTPPDQIFADLKKKGSPSAAASPAPAAQPAGMKPMAMAMGSSAKRDLNDVRYDAFLANDRTLADPEVIKVEPGGRVLLRVINGSSMSAYHVDLGQLDGELIAVDGIRIAPVTGRRFPIAVAQRLDIQLALPRETAAYPVLAQLEGERSQTGIILAAGRADIARVPEQAAMASLPLTLELEGRLRAAEPLPPRKVDRTHVLNLTGEMAGYIWSINNVAWTPQTPPLPIAAGERVQLVFVNKTMMSHPMHLHGHTFQVVEIDGQPLLGALHDTVLVPPSARVAVVFDANNPGYWALHCHLLYHLDAGMFTTLRYV
jgi:FtsP/CotA-like multicopper oxidase with cupredoxin domain